MALSIGKYFSLQLKEEKMKKNLTDTEIIAALAEPLAIVIGALRTGKFAPAPKELVGKREAVIGELTSFEKAVYTAGDSAHDSIKAIAKANNRMVDETLEKETTIDVAKVKENKTLVKLYEKTFEALHALFWASIQQRLGAPAFSHDIGIRRGYKIVQIKSPSIIESLLELEENIELLSKLTSHNCDGCDTYDECNLPIKKPRK